jgi:hypothetical protein
VTSTGTVAPSARRPVICVGGRAFAGAQPRRVASAILEELPPAAGLFLPVGLVQQQCERPALHLTALGAENALGGSVELQDSPGGIGQDDAVGDALEDRPCELP